ncbi:toll/interleukin-1 receptor domain-containing protein [Nocardioides sediminis]|uniref:toll/interleukin-1 receptor domain-containing protein n=1 Tax=Nocardioides sediminis TaxID=433648 RepID=UPI00131EE875|nr:toll/interleukin-1 receptor domain-containing protein [Nocardioides sediminis]
MQTSPPPEQPEPPVAFVSYSWAGDQHVAWVANLARRLRANGVDVHLDRWDVRLGHDLNLFMERYADPSARVMIVLSDDYGPKADRRAEQSSGVGTETTIVSPTVYRDLGGNRVIPVVPDSGTVADDPVVPTYLVGRTWIDFRSDHEAAYERLLRELHGAPVEAAPPLGPNPFVGTTEAQARATIRNDPARWRDGRTSGLVAVNLNENSGQFTLGSDEARFELHMDYPYGGAIHPSAPKGVRHYKDGIGNIGLVAAAAERRETLADLAALPMSNRAERTTPGDVLVMMNRSGYWALLILDDVIFRPALNGYEPVAVVRYVIATDRTAALTLDDLPTLAAERRS